MPLTKMINDRPNYFGVMLFGTELSQTVTAPRLFAFLAGKLHGLFLRHKTLARCRGLILGGRGKNVAPRAGIFNDRMLGTWTDKLRKPEGEHFFRLEMFGPSWREHEGPMIYTLIEKIWQNLPGAYSERTLVQAENSVSFAIHKSLLNVPVPELEALAKELFLAIGGLHGYLNPSDAWDWSIGGTGRSWLMDIRVRDILAHKYGQGRRHTMGDRIPGLYFGNILRPAHFKDLAMHRPKFSEIGQLEDWPGGAIYARFPGDPQADEALLQSLIPYFNLTGE